MKKPTHKKNTLLKNAEANAEGIFFKRVFFSPTQKEIQIIFFPTLRFFYFFFQRTVRNWTGNTSIIGDFGKSEYKLDTTTLRTDRRATDNSGFKKLAVQWFNEHSTSHQHLWWLDSFVLRNRQLLKPTKRYR
jgi:hypothetical protein